jgi:gliding motility-associated-like protein
LLSSPPASYDPLYIAGFTSSGAYVSGTTLQSGGDDQVGLAADALGAVYLSGDYVGKIPFSIGNNNFPVEVSSEELLYIAKFAPRDPTVTNRHSDTTMCYKSGMILNADAGYAKYAWNDGQTTVSRSVKDTGIFWVFGSDNCAAFVSDTFRIKGICDCDKSLFVPNTFTPNGDGQNDVFYPRCGSDITKVTVFRVYNRWGTLLFERENINPNDAANSWDGSFQGSLPLPDVYIYVVDAICENGKVINKKGSVTVIR